MKLPYPHLPKSEQWNGKWRGVTGEKESQVKGVGLKKQPFGPKGTWYVDLSLVSKKYYTPNLSSSCISWNSFLL